MTSFVIINNHKKTRLSELEIMVLPVLRLGVSCRCQTAWRNWQQIQVRHMDIFIMTVAN